MIANRLVTTLAVLGLGVACTPGLAEIEDGEWLVGGEAGTNRFLGGSNSFLPPMPGLDEDDRLRFFSGNSFFNQSWVEAPASTEARDGLGPYFNERSCSGCHFKDGRAAPPETGEAPFGGLLLRLGVPGDEGIEPHPVYGVQVQDRALPGLEPELQPNVTWTEEPGEYPDGTPYSLLRPTYTLHSPIYGPVGDDVLITPRIAVPPIGLGLLEAISLDRLEELADPDDIDGDGISGRIPWSSALETDELLPGRVGWKGEVPTVESQVAKALSFDMGLTSPLLPIDDCTDVQTECIESLSGGDPEVSETIFDRMVVYSRVLAVPARRDAESDEILRGKFLFSEVGCDGCHVANHTTEAFDAVPELEGQLIWPYTDLLLHDMGEGLADGRPEESATGSEWQTRPLWGIGLVPVVNGHTRYLHDGRARSLEEAVLWHGGEAAEPAGRFRVLSVEDRAALLAFVGDL